MPLTPPDLTPVPVPPGNTVYITDTEAVDAICHVLEADDNPDFHPILRILLLTGRDAR